MQKLLNTGETVEVCWACGIELQDTEHGLCTDCQLEADQSTQEAEQFNYDAYGE